MSTTIIRSTDGFKIDTPTQSTISATAPPMAEGGVDVEAQKRKVEEEWYDENEAKERRDQWKKAVKYSNRRR